MTGSFSAPKAELLRAGLRACYSRLVGCAVLALRSTWEAPVTVIFNDLVLVCSVWLLLSLLQRIVKTMASMGMASKKDPRNCMSAFADGHKSWRLARELLHSAAVPSQGLVSGRQLQGTCMLSHISS